MPETDKGDLWTGVGADVVHHSESGNSHSDTKVLSIKSDRSSWSKRFYLSVILFQPRGGWCCRAPVAAVLGTISIEVVVVVCAVRCAGHGVLPRLVGHAERLWPRPVSTRGLEYIPPIDAGLPWCTGVRALMGFARMGFARMGFARMGDIALCKDFV